MGVGPRRDCGPGPLHDKTPPGPRTVGRRGGKREQTRRLCAAGREEIKIDIRKAQIEAGKRIQSSGGADRSVGRRRRGGRGAACIHSISTVGNGGGDVKAALLLHIKFTSSASDQIAFDCQRQRDRSSVTDADFDDVRHPIHVILRLLLIVFSETMPMAP